MINIHEIGLNAIKPLLGKFGFQHRLLRASFSLMAIKQNPHISRAFASDMGADAYRKPSAYGV